MEAKVLTQSVKKLVYLKRAISGRSKIPLSYITIRSAYLLVLNDLTWPHYGSMKRKYETTCLLTAKPFGSIGVTMLYYDGLDLARLMRCLSLVPEVGQYRLTQVVREASHSLMVSTA